MMISQPLGVYCKLTFKLAVKFILILTDLVCEGVNSILIPTP